MIDWHIILSSGLLMLAMAIGTWLLSLVLRDVSIVDSLWSLFFLAAAVICMQMSPEIGLRATLVLALVGIWSIRLSAYLTWRNWGEPEDHRYQAFRRNHDPGFAFKSLYIIFGLQALLAWIISFPIYAAMTGPWPFGALDVAGAVLVVIGIGFESIGDWQLARFKARPTNDGRVLDSGLWRYTRHPNYFGDFCVWWGLYLIAVSAGGWWTVFSPLLMSLMLLRVSGVTLLEKDIGERRPAYADYVARTNAFFPGPRKTADSAAAVSGKTVKQR